MNDTRKSSKQGRNHPFALLNRTLVVRWAPIPLRLIVGYSSMPHTFAKLSKAPEAFAMIPQRAAGAYDRPNYYGEPKNG